MKERNTVLMVFSALVVRELWLLIPVTNEMITPFPLYDMEISRQSYLYFGCFYASMMIIAYAFWYNSESFSTVYAMWFYLQLVEFIDYWLTYNTAWFHIFGIEVGMTVIKFVTLFCFIIYRLWR